MIDRTLFMQQLLPGKSALGIEIAPAHNPVCPKSDGWNVKSVDCYSTEDLFAHLSKNAGNTIEKVEPVDIVWDSGALHEKVDPALHGKFKFVIASHVFEHIPDIIRFMQSMRILLADDGFILLALPDRRYMFDFLRPFSTVADAIEAYDEKRTRHGLRAVFLTYFYTCWVSKLAAENENFSDQLETILVDNLPAWNEDVLPTRFQNSFANAAKEYEICMEKLKHGYVDMHAWAFTPASFKLMMLELFLMDFSAFEVTELSRLEGIKNEFFAILRPAAKPAVLDEQMDKTRFDLAVASILEYSNGAEHLPKAAAPENLPAPESAAPAIYNPYPAESRRHRIYAHMQDIKTHLRGARDHMRNISNIIAGKI